VGAPAQAFERVASRFYNMIEWIEANCLGWKIPGEDDMIPMYKQIKLYYHRSTPIPLTATGDMLTSSSSSS